MPSKHRFLVCAREQAVPRSPRPVFVLTSDKWDDFGHVVQFHLSYIDGGGVKASLGAVKILQRTSAAGDSIEVAKSTNLPRSFSALDGRFISLGQEDDYYKQIRLTFGKKAGSVLDALRDIAWQPGLAFDFEPTTAFRNALMRENGAKRARRFGRQWALKKKTYDRFDFTYCGSIKGAAADVEATFSFDRKDAIPGRIVGIIGRNAVGKTQFLASLGNDLAQIERVSVTKVTEREDRFPRGRPLFTRIITISYSAFDRFTRPKRNKTSSYVYCGIRNEKGGLSRISLAAAYRRNQDRIRNLRLESKWVGYMQDILGDLSGELVTGLKQEMDGVAKVGSTLSLLSSGQAILAHFVTALLGWIQPNSLILFDEPETHLHPNAVANLFLVFSAILEDFDSYAVMATHSPVVIREIPAKRVIVFEREEDLTTAHSLTVESFGESVAELTKHVFETVEVDSVYRRVLKELANDEPAERVLARFDRGLSLNAQAYLLAQYGKKTSKKK